MARRTGSPADELREHGARAKRAAKAALDPREKERLDRIAKEDQAKAIDVENDFS
jgi:DNA-binding CsgD family transcriptional regulator